MIDPRDLHGCNPEELAMFACCVHGKLAETQAKKFNALLRDLMDVQGSCSPLGAWSLLPPAAGTALLRKHGIGQYAKIAKAWTGLCRLLKPYAVEGLVTVHGIGPKTARFIAVYSGSEPDRAILDVHVMRWLRRTTGKRFWRTDSTPGTEKAYAAAEAAFLEQARLRGMTPAELDTEIWKAAQKRAGGASE